MVSLSSPFDLVMLWVVGSHILNFNNSWKFQNFQEMPDKNRKTKERRDQADGGRRSLDEGVPERRMDWKDVCMRINEEGGK